MDAPMPGKTRGLLHVLAISGLPGLWSDVRQRIVSRSQHVDTGGASLQYAFACVLLGRFAV